MIGQGMIGYIKSEIELEKEEVAVKCKSLIFKQFI